MLRALAIGLSSESRVRAALALCRTFGAETRSPEPPVAKVP